MPTSANRVSVLIFTLNEEPNLPYCLDSVAWSDDVLVVDSYSTDRTLDICRERGIRTSQHPFEGFGSQRNWALENLDIKHPWVLILDADERVPTELAREIMDKTRNSDIDVVAYAVRRRFHLWGKWLKHSSLYPTWVVRLIRRDKVRYVDRGHAENQEIFGETGVLDNDLIDENQKGMEEWFERQNRYSTKEAEYELAGKQDVFSIRNLASSNPIVRRASLKRLAHKLPCRALWYFLYSYFWRRGFLDGKEGLIYCMMRSTYQGMIEIKKYDRRKAGTTQAS